jgi:hypothetical protein
VKSNLVHLSRKPVFISSSFWILTVLLLGLLSPIARTIATDHYTLENELIKLSNAAYEVAFSDETGAIAYTLDKSTGQNISDGNVDDSLWSISLDNGDVIDSASYAGQFEQAWDAANKTLTLNYSGSIGVQVTITVSDNHALKMQADVTNNSGANISDFEFPKGLKVVEADVQDALLPMMPGAQINSTFFSEGRSFINTYPGIMFADYLAIRSARGKIAVYSQREGFVQPILIGYEHSKAEPEYTTITHRYQTWILDSKEWLSPWVVINVGEDYQDSILGYRADNRINEYKSLETKLGDAMQVYAESPMYKLDLAALRVKFADIQASIIDKINFPGIIHFVAFQTGGHDKTYPDFIPPDTKWGTTEDFANVVGVIHEQGGLAIPYTNFSWWDSDGPVLSHLPADLPLTDLVSIKDSHGLPGFETYGPNSGFVMNLHNDFVADKITEQHEALRDTVGVDGIFEDQWGARSAPYDFNPAGLDIYDPSTSYFEGVLKHYRAHADSNLMTEIGVDVLADDGIGFAGTNYLWDMLGYRGATAGVTSYYPMAGMLLRDKVLFYQHDLAAETWTKNKDMLSWNLAQGYNLSNAFLDSDKFELNMDNPWLNLVGVFQKYALSNYVDELVVNYEDLGKNVTKTGFSTYMVYANWDAENPYSIDQHTLAPGGVVSFANDGSVTAGVFTAYNEQPLSEGDHYLVEIQAEDAVKIFQPVGADTDLKIRYPIYWTTMSVSAYQYDETLIAPVEAVTADGYVSFAYAGEINGQAVGYYQIDVIE